MYTVEKFIDMVELNLMEQTKVLVEKMGKLKSIHYADEVKFLFIVGDMGGTTLSLNMDTRVDMFNGIDHDEVENGFAGSLDLVEEFVFNEWDEWEDEAEEDEFMAFYQENDLEDLVIGYIAGWVQHCFDQLSGEAFSLPIYFSLHDDPDVFDLTIGEWLDPEEVEMS